MYIDINFDRVNAHRAYIAEQDAMVRQLLTDMGALKYSLQDSSSMESYREIVRELELLRESIKFRNELMETAVSEFRHIGVQVDDLIADMNTLLGRQGIED